jgi:hypothetical protein
MLEHRTPRYKHTTSAKLVNRRILDNHGAERRVVFGRTLSEAHIANNSSLCRNSCGRPKVTVIKNTLDKVELLQNLRKFRITEARKGATLDGVKRSGSGL